MEDKIIHEFEFELINEFFTELERQGPGSAAQTLRALSFIDNVSSNTKIADLGCGTGAQTIVLAQNTQACVTALDLFPASVEKLNERTAALGLDGRVKGIVGSMDALPFGEREFDIIWSEGAIACIGFEKGLDHWRNYLKKDGYIALTYESWFTDTRPAEIENWWTDAVPEIDTVGRNISKMQSAGYTPVAAFALPDSCWIDNYFTPQKARWAEFLEKHAGNSAAENLVEMQKREARLYLKYKQYYGYVFYIGKKTD